MGSSPLLSLIWGNKEMCVSRFDSHLPEGRKWIYFRLLGLASFFLSPRHLSWVLRKQTNLALRAFCSPQALQCGIRFHISLYKIKPYNYKPYPHPQQCFKRSWSGVSGWYAFYFDWNLSHLRWILSTAIVPMICRIIFGDQMTQNSPPPHPHPRLVSLVASP